MAAFSVVYPFLRGMKNLPISIASVCRTCSTCVVGTTFYGFTGSRVHAPCRVHVCASGHLESFFRHFACFFGKAATWALVVAGITFMNQCFAMTTGAVKKRSCIGLGQNLGVLLRDGVDVLGGSILVSGH